MSFNKYTNHNGICNTISDKITKDVVELCCLGSRERVSQKRFVIIFAGYLTGGGCTMVHPYKVYVPI